MAVANPCADAIRRAAAADLSDDEVLEIAETIQRRRNRLQAQGKLDRLDQRLAEIAREEGDQARLAAALARKHAALNAIVRDRLESQVLSHIAGGMSYRNAVLAVLEGTTRGVAGGRNSVAAHRLAYEARYVGDMFATLQRERPHLIRLLGDDRLMADAVREMYALGRPGGERPAGGVTGNADAAFLAETFAANAERSRLDLNRLGATIGKLDGWAGPQVHDPYRLLGVTRDQWIDDTLALLDVQRTFGDVLDDAGGIDVPRVREILDGVYATIVSGRDQTVTARERGEYVGPANLAKSLQRHRVLHFRGPDAWLAYHHQYGHGNLFSAMIGHQMRAAKLAAQMQVLGPNPKVMLDALLERLRRRARSDPAIADTKRAGIIRSLTSDRGGGIASAYAEMAGITSSPADVSAAKIGGAVRGLQSMAKLGGAVLSAIFGDQVMMAANLRFNGVPLPQAYSDTLGNFLQGRGQGEKREIAFAIGEAFDGLIGHIITPWVAGDGMPGAMHRGLMTFFRWSGLAWETDAMRAAGARALAAHIGRQAGAGWDALPARLRHVFGLHGIDARQWDAARSVAWREVNGVQYFTPDRMAEVPDAAIDDLIAEDIIALGETGRRPSRAAGEAPPPQDFAVEGAQRPAWAADFPDVVVQHPWGSKARTAVRKSPDYAAAKAGDFSAAERVVAQLVKPAVVERLRAVIGDQDAVLVPVAAVEAAGRNRLPTVYAAALAERLDLNTARSIVQVTKAGHTGAGAAERLVRRAEFDGPVERGRAYVIVDDHVTLGGTVADLRAYIESRGGRVVAVSSLSASAGSQRLRLAPERLAELRARFGDVEPWFKDRFGHGYEGLTHHEAGQLLRYGSADAFRSGLAAARNRRVSGAEAGGAGSAQAGGAQGGPAEGRGEAAALSEDDPRVARLRERARLELELAWRRYFSDEVSFGHIETDEASRRWVIHGTQPGSVVGEALRFLMQFKGFPLAFTRRVLGRAFYGGPGATRAERALHMVPHVGHLLAGLTIAGYMSMTAKDMSRGWEPRVPHDFQSLSKILAASMVQGGGAGIYGDLLFGEANRFGGGALETLAGPTIGEAATLVDIWNRTREGDFKAFRWIWGNTPYVNLWYLRPAVDYLFLNAMHESMSPGYLRRQKRRRRRDYRQQRLWEPLK